MLKPIIFDLVKVLTKNKDKKKMDKRLYYEVDVTAATDIKRAYDYVVANNIKFYRCVAKDGSVYGWNLDNYIKAQIGQEWFENINYKEPENNIDPHICLNNAFFNKENTKIENDVKPIEFNEISAENTAEIEEKNYKALYEAANEELCAMKNAFAIIFKQIKSAVDNTE